VTRYSLVINGISVGRHHISQHARFCFVGVDFEQMAAVSLCSPYKRLLVYQIHALPNTQCIAPSQHLAAVQQVVVTGSHTAVVASSCWFALQLHSARQCIADRDTAHHDALCYDQLAVTVSHAAVLARLCWCALRLGGFSHRPCNLFALWWCCSK
jgi:hypothetical protein